MSASKSPRVPVVRDRDTGLRVGPECENAPSESEKVNQLFHSFYPRCG